MHAYVSGTHYTLRDCCSAVHTHPREPRPERLVVRRGHAQELDAARAQRCDGVQDVMRAQRDVLDALAAVVFDVLLNLRLALARGGLVDGHLDHLAVVRHNDRAQRAVLGVHLRCGRDTRTQGPGSAPPPRAPVCRPRSKSDETA